jgi:hypothetical protein
MSPFDQSRELLVALPRAESAVTILGSGFLAALSWIVLSARRAVVRRWGHRLLASTVAFVALLGAFALTATLTDQAFEPWHYVGVYCWPPSPRVQYVVIASAVLYPALFWLSHRHRPVA